MSADQLREDNDDWKKKIDWKKFKIGLIEMIGGVILMFGSGYFATGLGFYQMDKWIHFSEMNIQNQVGMQVPAFLILLAAAVLTLKGVYDCKCSFLHGFQQVRYPFDS